MTNFEKITQSPKELAGFLDVLTVKCMVGKCYECELYPACQREGNNVINVEQFLNSEVEK